jgi:predicted ATPase
MPEGAFAMLTDVTIEGLRGVGRVELRFAPEQRVYVLFGANGVGKTKCLEALYQFLLFRNKDFSSFAKRNLGWDVENPWPVMSCVRSAVDEAAFEIPDDRLLVADESARAAWLFSFAPSHSLPVVFLGAGRRASFEERIPDPDKPLGKFELRRKEYFDEVVQALQKGRLSSLGMAGDTRSWFVRRAQSDNPYQKDKDVRSVEIDTVVSVLHAIEPGIGPESLRIDGNGDVFLNVGEEKHEFGELSSGFSALVKMVQAIVAGYAAFTNEKQLQNVRGIVFIDEIDAHLHVEWQVKIISCLKSLFPNTTFYIATHSPLVLKQLKEKEAYLLKRDDDGVVRSRIISHPNRRLFVDVLEDGFGVDLNRLKRGAVEVDDQSELKAQLLSLLRAHKEGAT